MPAGRLSVGGKVIAEGLGLSLSGQVEPVLAGPERRTQVLHAMSGRASLAGKVVTLDFLGPYLQKTPWLRISGSGAVTADVGIERGTIAPGTRLTVTGTPAATILESRATGQGTVSLVVLPTAKGASTTLRLRFDRFALADTRQPKAAPYLRGRGLEVVAVAPLAVDVTHPLVDFDATIDLPDGEIPDITTYGRMLPRDAGLALLGGRGRARLHLVASSATRAARGTVSLTSDDGRLRFQNLELQGRLSLRAPIASPDLMARRFDLAGTKLDLDGIATRDVESADPPPPGGWWAHAELRRGTLLWNEAPTIRAHVALTMRDTGPLLTVFSQKSRLLRWFDKVLLVENVAAETGLRIEGGAIVIDDLRATGGDLEVRSRMKFQKARRRGDLYVRWHKLGAGIALRDGERQIQLRKPLEWYEAGSLP
jgi:hypothetical protein